MVELSKVTFMASPPIPSQPIPPINGVFHLVERNPIITGSEIAAELVPPRQFEHASFESYIPNSEFPSQSEALDILVDFSQNEQKNRRTGGFFGRRKARTASASASPGVYLDGGFGVGKTHLLAATWHNASGKKYFGTFIEYTALVGALGYSATVELLKGAQMVCIDEFELDDPGDTMIMTRLLSELVASGSHIVATSNTPPNALGEGRFAAADFLREIQALSAHFRTVRIDGNDYRQRGINGRAQMLEESELVRTVSERVRDQTAVVLDDFGDFLDHLSTVHQSRYIKMIEGINTIAWTNIREMTNQSEALRFVAFVDRVYDAQIPILASGFPLEWVFTDEMMSGGYQKKYLRAISRLIALTNEL